MGIRYANIAGEVIDEENPIDWAHPLNAGLLAEWAVTTGAYAGGQKMLDMAGVKSVKRNPGIFSNGPTWQGPTRPGGLGSIAFDGSNDSVSVAASASSLAPSALTVALWVRTTTGFKSLAGCNAFSGWQLFINTPGTVRWAVVNNSSNLISSTKSITDGKWHHVAGTYDGTGNGAVWIDGNQDNSFSATGTGAPTLTASWTWGTSASSFFAGNLDDICVYNRALSASEIMGLYLEAIAGNRRRWNWLRGRRNVQAGSATNYTLTAAAGAFAHAGQAAALKAALKLTAATGAFAEAGQAAGLKAALKLTAATGAFSAAGQAAALKSAFKLSAAAGAFAHAGQAAALKGAFKLTCSAGACALTGNAAGLIAPNSYVLSASPAAFAVAGQAAGLKATRTTIAATGAIGLTGQAATLKAALQLAAARGTFVVAGQSAALTWSGALFAGPGIAVDLPYRPCALDLPYRPTAVDLVTR